MAGSLPVDVRRSQQFARRKWRPGMRRIHINFPEDRRDDRLCGDWYRRDLLCLASTHAPEQDAERYRTSRRDGATGDAHGHVSDVRHRARV